LPTPTGPHAVGRTAFDLVDADRKDPLRGVAGRLVGWRFGCGTPPSSKNMVPAPGSYLPGAWSTIRWLRGLCDSQVRGHSIPGAPPTYDASFPLVVLSPSANPPLLYAVAPRGAGKPRQRRGRVSHTYEAIPLSVFVDAWPRLGGCRPRRARSSATPPCDVLLRGKGGTAGLTRAMALETAPQSG